MAITLGTNVSSLSTSANLNKTDKNLSATIERLSTGFKINNASDDAAGLVISKNMETKIAASNQALDNIQNAKSFLSVAEDGMETITEHIQRINDLLVEMANDTNGTDSRTASVNEIVERLSEIDRLARSTDFNGKKMLDGSQTSIIVQLGPDSNEDSIIDIAPALNKCFVSSLGNIAGNETGIRLPANLNPNAYYCSADSKYYVKNSDNTYDEIDENGKIIKTGVSVEGKTLESAFEPTNTNCRAYMAKIENAIDEITTKRGLLGAYENRMESSYDNLTTRVESLEESKSNYQDANVAQEATNLTKYQILEQVGVSVLAVANSLPQYALSLLG